MPHQDLAPTPSSAVHRKACHATIDTNVFTMQAPRVVHSAHD